MKAENIRTLDSLRPGESACIASLCCGGSLRRRLMELGMVERTPVRCLYRGASGSPIAFCIRGTVIALRAVDAAEIWIV